MSEKGQAEKTHDQILTKSCIFFFKESWVVSQRQIRS
jgi:hypothetical protein